MVPQGAPGLPKWNPKMLKRRHRAFQMTSEEKKKHDMLKWMLGCSRGVKMVAKIISHDASEEKGPAAEGVAFKIIWDHPDHVGSCGIIWDHLGPSEII